MQSRLKRIHVEKKNRKNLYALLSLQMELDMDGVKGLSQYDRHQVQVPKICDCNKMTCQYKRFVADSNSTRYLFQICNHNLLLADALHREKQLRPILPDYSAIVLDEAHKLPEAAKQMFGKTLPQEEMRSLVKGLRIEKMCIRDRPYSILLGAFTLLLADTLGRTIAAPYEISAAIIMSVVGGPFFILRLRRSRQSYGQ